MSRSAKLLIATVAATAVAAPVAIAKEGFHAYSYSNPNAGLSVSLVREEGSSKVTADISQLCAGPEGDRDGSVTVSTQLKGKLKDEKIDLKGKAPTGGFGTASVRGSMTLQKFKGKVKLDVPIEGVGRCKVAKRFSAKHTFQTGG